MQEDSAAKNGPDKELPLQKGDPMIIVCKDFLADVKESGEPNEQDDSAA